MAFDKEWLVRLSQLYPDDFPEVEVFGLENQLETYITNVRSCIEFNNLLRINDLVMRLVGLEEKLYIHWSIAL